IVERHADRPAIALLPSQRQALFDEWPRSRAIALIDRHAGESRQRICATTGISQTIIESEAFLREGARLIESALAIGEPAGSPIARALSMRRAPSRRKASLSMIVWEIPVVAQMR